ncbi:MAG TPA: hypothetical protein DCL83_13050, partial [Arthrobacter bacterium]|nr:hypothetical protein [Arthrobacter sp.]
MAFGTSSVAAMRTAAGATRSAQSTPGAADPITTARAGAVTPVQDVAGDLAVVGVTWPKNAVSAGDQFQIRTLTGAAWSQWETLDADQGDGPDPAEAATATRGTSPYVVTGASKFEVRSLTTDQAAPTAAKVQVVDPGTSGADDLRAAPGAAEAAAAKPVIYTRAQWGADESLRRAAPVYGQVQLGFVHHTVSSNSYTSSQVPAMIRGIYAYHVKAEGWNDIGYNFLIDKFGNVYEGRYSRDYGGANPSGDDASGKGVTGAHTLGWNSGTVGIALLGTFTGQDVTPAARQALESMLAWEASRNGINPQATEPFVNPVSGATITSANIAGHRDYNATACPGDTFYQTLPTIRADVAARITGSSPDTTPPTTYSG